MYSKKPLFILTAIISLILCVQCLPAFAQKMRIKTSMGNIDINFVTESPNTVTNFLRYVDAGRYDGTFIHRSVPSFVFQGGGYSFDGTNTSSVTAYPPIANEFHVSNTRGTLAMATISGDPNSATSQWFFNTVNNASILDNQNGGYTVFARVADAQSLAVMDAIAAVPNYNLGGAFANIPLIDYSGTGAVLVSNTIRIQSIRRAAGSANDFDGDGKTDLSVYRPTDNKWYIKNSSTGSMSVAPFGLPTDQLAPADYDGDGKTDVAVWRENAVGSQGYFYIVNSSNNSLRIEPLGLTGDKLSVADYDGDGKGDLSVYREGSQGYFYYIGSFNNSNRNVSYTPWGITGDKPVSGDFDGDGKSDVAIYRPSNGTWYVRRSSDSQTIFQPFGSSTDNLVPEDYDGDGKTDFAVFRPSNNTWYLLETSNNQSRAAVFGSSGDAPAPADYDGDGKADIATWRPTTGLWFVGSTANNNVQVVAFGQPGDVSIPSAFVR